VIRVRTPTLGIDIGRVIIGAVDDGGNADTAFLSGGEAAAMETPATEGALDTIRDLVAHFEGRVWLVSKCGPRVEARTRRWFLHQGFHRRTGLPAAQVLFCRDRAGKLPHCRRIGATHFIDDRLDVLGHLRGAVPQLYWFGRPLPAEPPSWVVHAPDWAAIRTLLLPGR